MFAENESLLHQFSMEAIKDLSDKNVLITGGGSGIGMASAWTLARKGAKVAITGRRIEKLTDTVSASPENSEILIKESDVTDRKSLEELFQWFDHKFGSLDCLVHAAGINVVMRSMEELPTKDWDKLIQTNLTGSYNVMRLALERMRIQKKGLIILINSVAGKRSVPLGGIGYNASKFGMSGLGMGVAEEVKDHGIRITNLYPGEVNTPILDNRKKPPSKEHRDGILQAEDLAAVVQYICELPERVHIPELVIKPAQQSFV